MSDFVRRKEMLDELGVKYWVEQEMRGPVGPERKYYDIELFKQIRPPFDAETWMSLCTNDGDNYIGGCCGTMSGLQDKMENWFRFENQYLNTRELEEAEGYWVNHPDGAGLWILEEGQTIGDIFITIKEKWNSLRPWDKLGAIWQIVKGYHNRESIGRSIDPSFSDFDEALSTTSGLSWALSWAKHSKDDSSTFTANQRITLSQILPAINTIYQTLQEILKNEAPFVGFVLVDLSRSGYDNISRSRHGLSVFATLDEANKALDDQQEYEDKYQERFHDDKSKLVRERFGIRPVRITLEKGLEFTGDLIK